MPFRREAASASRQQDWERGAFIPEPGAGSSDFEKADQI
jgi:hypothetical protein